MFAYVVLAALVNAYAAGNLRDGSELLEVGLFALFAIAGELLFLGLIAAPDGSSSSPCRRL